MRRLLFIVLCLLLSVRSFGYGWASINIDKQTLAAMVGAYALEYETEQSNTESIRKILDHYSSAEVATAGIFASKWLDRQAMKNVGSFGNAEENFYYKRIYWLVSARIMPKIFQVASLMIRYPEKALYWGPYLFGVCEQTKQLCMTFEVVVCNGKVSFKEIPFLVINDNLRDLFDLARLGGVDWRKLLDKLTDFGSGLTKEDLLDDLQGLLDAGSSIASAGGAVLGDMAASGSRVGKIFQMKPREILELYGDFEEMYHTLSDPSRIKDLVMGKVLSTDSLGVSRLFQVDGYNITSYISDYIQDLQGRYYTQRWYIYWQDAGSSLVCSYSPPNDAESISYSPEWYRVNTRRTNYSYSSYDYEASLANSEMYAGWSRSKVNELNSHHDGSHYDFYNYLTSSQITNSSGRTVGWAFAHWIDVYVSWDGSQSVYEETFDSQYDDEKAIQARFNAKLSELNANEEGKVYVIGKDEKRYYDAADEAKLKGCASVSFSMECHDETRLGEGSFSWKENGDQRTCLNEDSKRFAMESTLSGGPDTSKADAEIEHYRSLVDDYQSQIDVLDSRNEELLIQIGESSVEDAEALRAQYEENLKQINNIRPKLDEAQRMLDEYSSALNDLLEDYYDERDGTYRIPAVMHELEGAYGISWDDAGMWVSFSSSQAVFERHGHMPNIQSELIFRAELRPERQESHNWLIGRYHRAILGVSWTLTASHSSSEIVEYMELDASITEQERAQQVNDRLRELMQEHPSCDIIPHYAYSAPDSIGNDDDAIHLLWISDRLAVARDVDYRLSKIYAQLVLMEKFLRARMELEDYLSRVLGVSVLNTTGRRKVGNKSFRRWYRAAQAAASGQSIADVLAAMQEDGSDLDD